MNENNTNKIEVSSSNPIRLYPQLYFSNFTMRGLCQLIVDTIRHLIDPKFANSCSHVKISINLDNSITIADNGKGLPQRLVEGEVKPSGLELIMTTIYAGSAASYSEYKNCSFLFNFIGPVLNAFSQLLVIETTVEEHRYILTCGRGEIIENLRDLGHTSEKGTKIYFHPDPSIWTEIEITTENLINDLKKAASDYPEVRIIMKNKISGETFSF